MKSGDGRPHTDLLALSRQVEHAGERASGPRGVDVNANRCHMDWYFLTDRTRPDSGVRFANGFSVANGVSRLRHEPAPLGAQSVGRAAAIRTA